eukprot:1421841-Lingulodinium_polyedra.AAC.1
MVREVLAPAEVLLPVSGACVRHGNEINAPSPVSAPVRGGAGVGVHHTPARAEPEKGRRDLRIPVAL